MKTILSPKNPLSSEKLQQLVGEMQAQFNEFAPKLPEDAQKHARDFAGKCGEFIAFLKAQPADEADQGKVVEVLCAAQNQFSELLSESTSRLSEALTRNGELQTQLCELQTKVEKKELLPKADHEAALEQAKKDAAAAEREHTKLLGGRRAVLCEAKLPTPPDAALEGDDKAWDANKARFEKNFKELGEVGDLAKVKQGVLCNAIYTTPEAFELAKECLAAAGRKESGSNDPEPLAGGGAHGDVKKKIRLI